MHNLGEQLRQLLRLVMGVAGAKRNIYVQAPLSRRLAIPFCLDLIKQLADFLCRGDNRIEWYIFRIKVQQQVIREVQVCRARIPRVQLDASQVRQVDERGLILAEYRLSFLLATQAGGFCGRMSF